MAGRKKKSPVDASMANLPPLAKAIIPGTTPEVIPDNVDAASVEALQRLEALQEYKLSRLKVPTNLSADEAEKWADSELVSLLPRAVGELKGRLLHGDTKERWEAAKQVLESTGRGKSEKAVSSTPSIIIQLGGNAEQVNLYPWRKGSTNAQVVDGEVAGRKE